jgi:hypothetical protein
MLNLTRGIELAIKHVLIKIRRRGGNKDGKKQK